MRSRRLLVGFAAFAVMALLAGACGDDDEGGSSGGTADQSETITATDFEFDTTELTLEPGEVEVTLVNDGETEHGFTSDDLDFESEAEPGEEASVTFTVPEGDGTYEYHCQYHPDQMTGTITVGSGGSDTGGSDDTSDDDDDDDY